MEFKKYKGYGTNKASDYMDIGADSRFSRFWRAVGVLVARMGIGLPDVGNARERAIMGQIRVILK